MIGILHHFANAKNLTQFLLSHRALNSAYYQEKGITLLVARLAAQRFADRIESPSSITHGAMLIAADLQRGEDGYIVS